LRNISAKLENLCKSNRVLDLSSFKFTFLRKEMLNDFQVEAEEKQSK
jgi:hypothetical protein